ncbi:MULTISPECIES: sugar phosphate nucleotidyltransferase [Streptomycetaceae]|uniref:Mannose-1-phosphate guanyltransferase n=1 Tax=Streptantibioticus cattleyicolor (strain ATCC 35852 / DSM 46488 / JCM 4925 / NBRC 14057 / NRRL 8057) TaxID=1003195 RepID=F8JU11_STREN|nr:MULTISPECIES: sugar phosphate nucleotidyltransferase [Streptomycetaceae]AEW98163.1 mannose-1-phosphate guanyltransferase [Streptantibioticus cattleyicolor NRRL 8057 = DSM 46488]MYS62548.1 NTP transferase domain-containing protein [Streptomyces sp. SID5468]CCB78477.1 Mannose-1-phosphate guanyltransferase [Streptantibioticus cattleyicolor NRRL 8057 = DSM 46488]
MKAVVMAGGEGSRLRPLTATVPKPLLPVAGRPVMEHVLRLLRRHRLTSTVVTVAYLADAVREEFGDGSALGMQLAYAHESVPLGTAGSVRNAAGLLGGEPFVVISGDALTDFDLSALIAYHRAKKALVTVCLARVPEPVEFGITVTAPDGRIERFLEKPTWGQVFSDTVNTGIYVMEPQVLQHVPDGAADWSKDVFPALMAAGLPVFGYVAEGYWEDIGTHDSYLAAHADVLAGRVEVEPVGSEREAGIWVGDGARIAADAQLNAPVVIGPGAQIASGARVGPGTVIGAGTVVEQAAVAEGAVVGEHSYIGPAAALAGCVTGRNSRLRGGARIGEGAVLGDGCLLKEHATVAAGVMVPPGRTLEAHATAATTVLRARTPRTMFASRGLSGALGVDLTCESAARLAGAFATQVPDGAVVTVARDHSHAGQVLAPVLTAALRAAGVDVRDLGHLPLPVARHETALAGGGALIAAAAPGRPDCADLRVLDGDGIDATPAAHRTLERLMHRAEHRRTTAGHIGALHSGEAAAQAALDAYAGHLADRIPHPDAGDGGGGVRVVLDAAFGAAGLLLDAVISRTALRALVINTGLDGARATETATERHGALAYLGSVVTANNAAFGVRFDPTGERLHLVDGTGRPVPDETTLLLMCHLSAAHARTGRIALPATASRTAAGLAAAHGATVEYTPTTPGQLSRAAADGRTILAGDTEGAFVIPQAGPHPDAIAALLHLTALLRAHREPLSSLLAALPTPHVRRRRLPTPWETKGHLMRTVADQAGTRTIDTTDGIRIVEADGRWTLILPDPAHPATHLWAEAGTDAEAHALLDHWTTALTHPTTA